MSAADDIVSDMIVEFPDAPRSVIRDAMARTGRDMAADTYCYRVTDEPVVVAADSDYPEVEAPLGAQVLAIVSLKIGGRDAQPDIDFRQTSPTNVTFRTRPSQPTLYGVLAVQPKHGQMLPDELLIKYQNCVMEGTRSVLYKLPRQAWTDINMHQYHDRLYSAAKADVRRDFAMGLQGGTHLMTFPRFD